MYLRRCVFAAVLGLVWYFSDFGLVLVQACCCVVAFLVSVPAEGPSRVSERSSQTDCTAEEAAGVPQQKSETGLIVGRDEPDTAIQTVQKISYQSQYPNIQRSLQHMFKCAYTHLILPWSIAPEPGDCQPLHTAVLTEFNFITDGIICKSKDLELSVIALRCIQIITQHLHNTKESEGSPAFSSKAEEIAVVRDLCKALIHDLFPEHLWEQNVYYCVLHEILTVKVLSLVTLLSDPDNLNHIIVSQLDKLEELHAPVRDLPSSNSSDNSDILQGEAMEHPSEKGKIKKKAKKLREKFSKLFNSNLKKATIKRKKETPTVIKPRPAALLTEDISNNDDSTSNSLVTDLQELMEFNLSYEMWKVGNWTVTITNVQMEGNELCFTVHLEESNNPETLQWDVKKNQSDIVDFYNQCKKMGHLPSLIIVEKPKTEWDRDEAREILENFLKVLVQNAELGDSELVFKFLCPLNETLLEEEHNYGVWTLLEGIASFLTVGQEDDELSNIKWENEQDVFPICNTSEFTLKHELDDTQTETTNSQDQELEDELLETDGGHLPTPPQTLSCISTEEQTGDTDNLYDQPEECPVGIDYNIKESKEKNLPKIPKRKSEETEEAVRKEKNSPPEEKTLSQPSGEKKTSNSWEQPEANKVIFDLLKEISGNSYTFKFMKTVLTPFSQMITKKVNAVLKNMYPSEAQIATYIESLCENLWPEREVAQPLPQSSDDKNETKCKALQIMTSKFAGIAVSKSNVESIFKIFQNTEENKKLVYMLLPYLLRTFSHEEPDFNVMSKLNVKPVNNTNGQF